MNDLIDGTTESTKNLLLREELLHSFQLTNLNVCHQLFIRNSFLNVD